MHPRNGLAHCPLLKAGAAVSAHSFDVAYTREFQNILSGSQSGFMLEPDGHREIAYHA